MEFGSRAQSYDGAVLGAGLLYGVVSVLHVPLQIDLGSCYGDHGSQLGSDVSSELEAFGHMPELTPN